MQNLLIRARRTNTAATIELPALDTMWTVPNNTVSISFRSQIKVTLPWGLEEVVYAESAPVTDSEIAGAEIDLDYVRRDSSSAALREAINLAIGMSIGDDRIDDWIPVPGIIGRYACGNVVTEIVRIEARIEVAR